MKSCQASPCLISWCRKAVGSVGAMVALVLEDDLGERHRGQVLAGGHVDDRDLLARADQLFELLEGDVAALLRVVELAVRVPLDHVRHARSLTLRVIGRDKAARRRSAILTPAVRALPTRHARGGAHAAQGTHRSRHRSLARDRPRHRAGPRRGGRRRGRQLRLERGAGQAGRRADPRRWVERRILAQADVADYPDTFRMAQDVLKEFGHLDILINNAGHQLRQDLREDGPRLVAQGSRHQPRRRLQLHQGRSSTR